MEFAGIDPTNKGGSSEDDTMQMMTSTRNNMKRALVAYAEPATDKSDAGIYKRLDIDEPGLGLGYQHPHRTVLCSR